MRAWNSIPPHEPKGYLAKFLYWIIRNLSINKCLENERLKRNAFVTQLSEEMEQYIPVSPDVEAQVDATILEQTIS